MFTHIFINRVKCITRSKETMFWTALFPLLLATLFYMALSNISSNELFFKINIAVVDNEEYQSNAAFKNTLEAVSDSEEPTGQNIMFNTKLTTRDEADNLLKDNKISGYIYLEKGIRLVVKESGFNQTIIKSFIEDFAQTNSTIVTILGESNSSNHNRLISDVADRQNYLKVVSANKANPDNTLNYFYTLIAMACLYGGFMGLKEVTAIQADLSSQGARVNMVPTHKLKVFGYSLCAATAVQLSTILILLAYLRFVLNINFGKQTGYILLTCVVGCFTGVSFGAMVSSVIKKGEGIKVAVLIATSMTFSFLSGMMVGDIKYIVNDKLPILGYINPANLITDAFYSLYFYDTLTRYFLNIGLLVIFTIVFYLATYFVLRRQKYASI